MVQSVPAGSRRVHRYPEDSPPRQPKKKRPRCLQCEDRKARPLRLPKALNAQIFFCSMTCAIEFAVLEARAQGLTFCTRCKEWAGRPESLCSCSKDDADLNQLEKSAKAGNGGAA